MAEVLLDNETSKSVVKTLLYYDIFQYPLTVAEVVQYMDTTPRRRDDVAETLNDLVGSGCIFRHDDFFSVRNDPAIIERRVRGNAAARSTMWLAERQAKLIYAFPFVRSVMISGSMSKNYMDEKSDLDFFIVTAPHRLWIARMMLVLYKRIVLGNSHRHFCVNYFVDSDHLEIEEKNLFTATELATLIPVCGNKYYHQLMACNKWVNRFFPNHRPRLAIREHGIRLRSKSILEAVFERLGARKWDELFMKLTGHRWQRIYGHAYSKEDFSIAFKTKKHASKNHPNHYQKRVVNAYMQKLAQFGSQFGISLNDE